MAVEVARGNASSNGGGSGNQQQLVGTQQQRQSSQQGMSQQLLLLSGNLPPPSSRAGYAALASGYRRVPGAAPTAGGTAIRTASRERRPGRGTGGKGCSRGGTDEREQQQQPLQRQPQRVFGIASLGIRQGGVGPIVDAVETKAGLVPIVMLVLSIAGGRGWHCKKYARFCIELWSIRPPCCRACSPPSPPPSTPHHYHPIMPKMPKSGKSAKKQWNGTNSHWICSIRGIIRGRWY